MSAKDFRKDLTGMKFGKLLVLYFDEHAYEKARENNKYIYKWVCECDCKETNKNIVSVRQISLLKGDTKSCGCIKTGNDIEDLTGQKFGRLTILKFDQDAYDKSKEKGSYDYRWICECSCKDHTIKSIDGSSLKQGHSISCGCYKTERIIEASKKYNRFNINNVCGIGWTTNTNKQFYFDLEDYDKIKDFAWHETHNGYIMCKVNDKNIRMHRLVMGLGEYDNKITVDHIYHNKQDNRKAYLRITSKQKNECNKKDAIGVFYDKSRNKWVGCLRFNGNNYRKRFDTYSEAVEYRKHLEDKYFKEYAYQEPPPEYIAELNELSKIN